MGVSDNLKTLAVLFLMSAAGFELHAKTEVEKKPHATPAVGVCKSPKNWARCCLDPESKGCDKILSEFGGDSTNVWTTAESRGLEPVRVRSVAERLHLSNQARLQKFACDRWQSQCDQNKEKKERDLIARFAKAKQSEKDKIEEQVRSDLRELSTSPNRTTQLNYQLECRDRGKGLELCAVKTQVAPNLKSAPLAKSNVPASPVHVAKTDRSIDVIEEKKPVAAPLEYFDPQEMRQLRVEEVDPQALRDAEPLFNELVKEGGVP